MNLYSQYFYRGLLFSEVQNCLSSKMQFDSIFKNVELAYIDTFKENYGED